MMTNTANQQPLLKRTLVAIGLVALVLLLIFPLHDVTNVLLVVFAGVLMATFLDGLAEFVMPKLRISRGLALFLSTLVLLFLMGLAVWLAGPGIAKQLSRLGEKIPTALENITGELKKHNWGQWLLESSPTAQDVLPLGSQFLGGVTLAFSSAVGAIIKLIVVLFVGIYLAVNPYSYISNMLRLIPEDRRERYREVVGAIGHALRWWLAGRIVSMLVVGILTAAGFWIIGMPVAVTLGLIAALLSFVPFLGPVMSVVPAVLVALADKPTMVVYVLLVYLIVQLLESYLITPLVQRRAIFILPALLITAQVVMGVLFGIIGLFLATPLAVVIIVLIQTLYVEDVLGDKVRLMGEH
jgi:predicted PurR-regulated permease PerM